LLAWLERGGDGSHEPPQDAGDKADR
jgi:hypothetical protein